MRIGIDARMMTAQATRGIGRYIEELVRAMLVLAPEHRYALVTRRAIHPFSSHPSVETVVADVPWYGFAEQVRMPGILSSLKADVLHVPHWNVPLVTRSVSVMTVHDLLLRHEPMSARISTHRPLVAALKRGGYRLTLAAALRHAKKILVPTEFTAADLRTLYPHTTDKIVITGEGMDHHEAFPTLVSSRPPQSKYLLYIGSAYPHKGLDLLVDVWEDIEAMHHDLRLKIAGTDDVFMQRLKDEVRKRKLTRIDFLGYVTEEDLPDLYADALAFVYPSRFEGFGLPPLEALQAGCPVISSDAAALPEVLGAEGAFFFQSGSRTGILQAVEEVLRNPELARRKIAATLDGLRFRHDWMKTAQRTLKVYESLPNR